MLDNACGNGLVTKGDAVEMMHVGVHLVYCCLRLKLEMRISEYRDDSEHFIFIFFGFNADTCATTKRKNET